MNVDLVNTGTANLVDGTVVIPKGARTIDLVNTGSTPITFKGLSGVGNLPSAPVSIPVEGAYSFGDVNKPYNEITVDATGSSADIAVNY